MLPITRMCCSALVWFDFCWCPLVPYVLCLRFDENGFLALPQNPPADLVSFQDELKLIVRVTCVW